jgi:glycosyltransferase involved in cell wall biosynthesis
MKDSHKMTVSVIVRAYNRAYIIKDALKSIVEQTYAPQEIIVVDDGSTDDTEATVRTLGDPRVRYIRHPVNRGPGAACNSGMAAAGCDLIAFLDSDDMWKPSYLEHQVSFLSRNPQAGAVFTDAEIYDDGILGPTLVCRLRVFSKFISTFPDREFMLPKRAFYLCLLQEIPVKPSAFVARKQAVTAVGPFNEEWRSGEDWEFFLRMAESAEFGIIREPLVVQRLAADSTYRLYCMEDNHNLLNLFVSKIEKFRGDREALAAVRKGIAFKCMFLGWRYREAGKRWRAVQSYLLGFLYSGDTMMLWRAVASYLPIKLRNRLKGSSLNPLLQKNPVVTAVEAKSEK